jgi:hypothetical protein
VRAQAAGRSERPTPTLSRQSYFYPQASGAANFFPPTLSAREAGPNFSRARGRPSLFSRFLTAFHCLCLPSRCSSCLGARDRVTSAFGVSEAEARRSALPRMETPAFSRLIFCRFLISNLGILRYFLGIEISYTSEGFFELLLLITGLLRLP